MAYLLEKSKIVVFPHETFVYRVDVDRSIKDVDGIFRMELLSSKDFEINKFIGLSSTEYHRDKKSGIIHSKCIELLAAPIEFIKEHNGTWYEHTTKKRKSKKKTVDKS